MKLEELEPWLREALRTQITATEKAVDKTRSDIEAQIASIREVVTDLLRKAEKDSTEKREDRAAFKSARAVGRMCMELQELLSTPPNGDTQRYEGLRQFSDTTARLANNAAQIRDKWIKPIRPYYILDMMSLSGAIDKLRRLGDQFWHLFSKEGSLLHHLEEIHTRVKKTEELEKSLQEQFSEYRQAIDEIKKIAPQIPEAERSVESLATNPNIAGMKKIDNRLRELRGELLTSGFRRLGRPLRKLETMASRGEYPVPPEVREKLSEYLRRPFTTFVHEKAGYPFLRSILRSLQEAIERRKLLLKQREERKVLERIKNVSEKNILDRIHHEATTLLDERKRQLQDPDCVEVVRRYKQKKEELKDLQSKHADLERRSKLLREKAETLENSVMQSAREVTLLAEKLVKRPVKVELDLSELRA